MKVLVVRAGALGDTLLLRRATTALRRVGHDVRLAAPRSGGRVLLGPGPAEVRELLALDGPRIAALLAGDPTASPVEADAILGLTRDRHLVDRLAGPRASVLQQDPAPPPGMHASRWLAGPVRRLGADPDTEPSLLAFTREERAEAETVLRALPPRFLALHPGAGSPAKTWPAERFAALARTHAPGRPWLLVVGPADEEAATPLASLSEAVLARGLPVRALGAVLARAGLVVGNDSGVTHLAAAAGAPTLALFGPTDPVRWAPVGPRVETVSSPDRQMGSLGVEEVSATVGRLLP